MAQLLAEAPDLDAVFVASDLMALGALQVLAEAGRRVPDDVAIVGFDASPLGASARPSITSVRQPIIEMGEALAGRQLDTIEHGEPQAPVVMRTEIALHETA
jgi:DNA-binding LacI/PurR family transcriptional regulator